MNRTLRPYPKYKDSDSSWLGKVPEHWAVLPNRAILGEVNKRDHAEEPLLSVTIAQGVLTQEDLLANSSKKDSSNLDKTNYKLVKPGDIVYNKMRAWQGALGVSQYQGIVSPAYVVARPRKQQVSKYYHYLMRTPAFTTEAERWSYGISSDQWSLRYEDFKQIHNLCPPPREQRAIVRFLEHVDRLTHRYIRAQQRLIELLDEQKQAIIQRAVTRGLSHDVPMKESGIEWLEEIPGHWQGRKLKYCAEANPSKSESSDILEREQSVVFLPMNQITEEGGIDCSERMLVKDLWDGYTYFRRHDVVVAKITPCFENGKGAYLGGLESEFGFGTTELIVLRANESVITPQYLYLLTLLPVFRIRGAKAMTGAAGQKRVPIDFVRNFTVPLPPIKEQREIYDFVQKKRELSKNAIALTRNRVELVQEYKTRLIADVVTGKLDVRDAQIEQIETHLDV